MNLINQNITQYTYIIIICQVHFSSNKTHLQVTMHPARRQFKQTYNLRKKKLHNSYKCWVCSYLLRMRELISGASKRGFEPTINKTSASCDGDNTSLNTQLSVCTNTFNKYLLWLMLINSVKCNFELKSQIKMMVHFIVKFQYNYIQFEESWSSIKFTSIPAIVVFMM